MAPTRFYADEALSIHFWNCVLITDSCGELTVARMKKLEEGAYRLLAMFPKGLAGLSFVRPGTPMPNSVARAESARLKKEMGPRMVVSAVVIEETGVAGVAIRSVVRGLNTLTRQSSLHIFANVEEAARPLAPIVTNLGGVVVTEADVVAAANEARMALGVRTRGPRLQPERW